MFLTPGGQSLMLLGFTDTLLTLLGTSWFFCGDFQWLSAKFQFLDSSNHIAQA